MCFAYATRSMLEHYTTNTPQNEIEWYGPWIGILLTFFTSGKGYLTTPRRCMGEEGQVGGGLIIEVDKLSIPSHTYRTVLILKIKNTHRWDDGIPDLDRQIAEWAELSFTKRAVEKVYWIEVIGPHWRYGIKHNDGQNPHPLIPWHHVTHDHASFEDLQALFDLAAEL